MSMCFKETTYYLVEFSAYGYEGLKFVLLFFVVVVVVLLLLYLKIIWDEVLILEEVVGYILDEFKELIDFLRRVARDA